MQAGARLAAASGAALASLVLALGGCGGGSSAAPAGGSPRPGGDARREAAAGTSAEAPRSGGDAANPVAVAGRCPAELTRFADSLQRLRHRLVAGLTYDEYVGAVKDLRSEYAAIPVAAVPAACLLSTGTPSERAFDTYVEAANRWGGCLSEPGCDAGDVEAPLQAEWHLASRQLDSLHKRGAG